MMRFQVFASGSAGNLYRVTAEGHAPLLIEAGLPYRRIQRLTNFQLPDYAGCLVSHAHGDHARAVDELLAQTVPVYTGRETAEAVIPDGHHNLYTLTPGEETQIGDWTVLPFELVHDVPNLGFLIVSKMGEKLLYITDSAYSPFRFEDITIAAVEANYSRGILDRMVDEGRLNAYQAARTVRNHMSIEHAAQLLLGLAGPTLREVHLLHLSNGNSHAAEFKAQIARIVGVPVHVADEGVKA